MTYQQRLEHRQLYNYLRWCTLPPGETMYANRITYTKPYAPVNSSATLAASNAAAGAGRAA